MSPSSVDYLLYTLVAGCIFNYLLGGPLLLLSEMACYVGNISHSVRSAIECQSVDCYVYWISLSDTCSKIQAVRIKM